MPQHPHPEKQVLVGHLRRWKKPDTRAPLGNGDGLEPERSVDPPSPTDLPVRRSTSSPQSRGGTWSRAPWRGLGERGSAQRVGPGTENTRDRRLDRVSHAEGRAAQLLSSPPHQHPGKLRTVGTGISQQAKRLRKHSSC